MFQNNVQLEADIWIFFPSFSLLAQVYLVIIDVEVIAATQLVIWVSACLLSLSCGHVLPVLAALSPA